MVRHTPSGRSAVDRDAVVETTLVPHGRQYSARQYSGRTVPVDTGPAMLGQ